MATLSRRRLRPRPMAPKIPPGPSRDPVSPSEMRAQLLYTDPHAAEIPARSHTLPTQAELPSASRLLSSAFSSSCLCWRHPQSHPRRIMLAMSSNPDTRSASPTQATPQVGSRAGVTTNLLAIIDWLLCCGARVRLQRTTKKDKRKHCIGRGTLMFKRNANAANLLIIT